MCLYAQFCFAKIECSNSVLQMTHLNLSVIKVMAAASILLQQKKVFYYLSQQGKTERAILEHHFPMNYTAFDPGRISRHGRFGRLLFQAKDNGTLLRDRHWSQISRINEIVMNTSIEYKGQVRLWRDESKRQVSGQS